MTDEAGLGGEELSPTDAAILEMIREGRYDAEIASRLYISTADVKARIERMLAQGGLRERSDFITPQEAQPEAPEPEQPPFERQPRSIPVHNALLAALGALAIGVGVGWVVRDEQTGGDGRDSHGKNVYIEREALKDIRIASAPTSGDPSQLRTALASLSTATPLSQKNFGTLFFASAGTPQTTLALNLNEQRHQLVELVGPAIVGDISTSTNPWTLERRSSGDVSFIGRLDHAYVTLKIQAANESTRIDRDGDVITISSTDGGRPQVELWVEGAPWLFTGDGRLVIWL